MKRQLLAALVMVLVLLATSGMADAPPGLPAAVLYVTPDQQVLAAETAYFPLGTTTYYANYAIIPQGYALTGDAFAQVVVTQEDTQLNPVVFRIAPAAAPAATFAPMPPVQVGSEVIFGRYEQDNNLNNGPEPVKWRVLAAEGGQALLVSVYALDTLPYHNQNQPVTWEWAAMRTWLNGAFLQQIFDGTEAAFVLTRELYNPANYVTGIYSGAATQDRVFLLSVEEVERYFMGAADRRAVNTPYANSKGAKTKNGYGTWWTRTAGSYEKNAAVVTADGNLGYKGYYMRDKVYTARPAIWVDLSGYMNSQLPPSG